MKRLILLIAQICLLVFVSNAMAVKKANFYSRWPFAAPKAIATNDLYVFAACGNIIRVFNKADLARTSLDVTIDTSEGITALQYQAPYLFAANSHKGLYRIDTNNLLGTPATIPVMGDKYSSGDDAVAGLTRGVAVSGNYAYAAYTKILPEITNLSSMVTGIEIIDINPGGGEMTSLAAADLNSDLIQVVFSDTRGVALLDNYAYVADFATGLHIFDVDLTNAENPLQRAWTENAAANDIDIEGAYAYISALEYGLQINDLSDPLKPVRLNKYDASQPTLSGQYYNGKMSYADGTGVTNSSGNPVNNPTRSQSLMADGTYVYLAEGMVGGNRAHLTAQGIEPETDPDGSEKQLEPDMRSGLKIIVVTDPNQLNVVGKYIENDQQEPIVGAYSVYYENDTAYIADYGLGISKIDVTDRSAPVSLAESGDMPADCTSFFLYNEQLTGDTNLYAYTLDNNGAEEGLRIIQFTPTNNILKTQYDSPRLQSFIPTSGNANDIFVAEHTVDNTTKVYAFLADGPKGLLIYNVSTKTNPVLMWSTDNYQTQEGADQRLLSMDAAQAVHTADSSLTWIFIADGENGVHSVRVADKSNPVYGSTVDTPGTARDLIHSGSYLYVADGEQGLQIIDNSDPTNLRLVSSGPDLGQNVSAKGITIWENYVYLADGANGVHIIDVSTPAAPVLTATFKTSDATAVKVAIPSTDTDSNLNPNGRTYAYVADGDAGMLTLDVTDPENPEAVSGWNYDTMGNVTDITVNELGNRVILANGQAGLTVISLSDDAEESTDTTTASLDNSCFITSLF